MFSQAILDRYRCPPSILDFSLGGQLSPEKGYFRVGPATVAYGRTTSGVQKERPDGSLADVLQGVAVADARLQLQFDPDEVIDNLRLERYIHSDRSASEKLLKEIYYRVRPVTSRAFRKQIQRFRARSWQESVFPHWPVDTTVERICESLLVLSMRARGLDRVPFVWFWPHSAQCCATITHDVETTAGRDFCSKLMEIDDAFGIKASFQIVPEDRYDVPEDLLETIRARGFETAVQDLNHDGRLFDNRELFLTRVARINSYAKKYSSKGFRAAVLYRNQSWFSDLDFSFDMSVPNVAPLDPQPGGCCTVMPYFIGKILELPVTTTQDYTLFHLLGQRSIDLWKTQIDLISERNGLAQFIVHPDYIQDRDTQAVYLDLLAHLREWRMKTPIWFALPSEIDSWWRLRSKMSVTKRGDTWQVEGEGAERASVAIAKIVNDKLVYGVLQSAVAN
jgi:hypothetical protein